MRHFIFFLLIPVGILFSGCMTSSGGYYPSTQTQEAVVQYERPTRQHNRYCLDENNKPTTDCDLSGWQQPRDLQNKKTTLGQRVFYSYIGKASRSPIKLRDKIRSDCSRFGYALQSSSCYKFAKDTFLQGGYEGYHKGLHALGYAFGWTKKKLGPSFDSILDEVWQGKE